MTKLCSYQLNYHASLFIITDLNSDYRNIHYFIMYLIGDYHIYSDFTWKVPACHLVDTLAHMS